MQKYSLFHHHTVPGTVRANDSATYVQDIQERGNLGTPKPTPSPTVPEKSR